MIFLPQITQIHADGEQMNNYLRASVKYALLFIAAGGGLHRSNLRQTRLVN